MSHKYVNTKRIGYVIFPRTDFVSHAQVGRLFGGATSAGFVHFANGKPECYGRSESLSLNSDPRDSEIMAEQLGL